MSIGKLIKLHRKKSKLQSKDLANYLNTTQSYITMIEKDFSTISTKNLAKIIIYLQIPVKDICEEIKEKYRKLSDDEFKNINAELMMEYYRNINNVYEDRN